MNLVLLTACNADKSGNIASQVQLRVHPYGTFSAAMPSPGKQRQAKIDYGGIECVNRAFEIHAERLMCIQHTSLADQDQPDVAIDSPVAKFVGFGECVARDSGFHAGVIKFGTDGSQAGFDVAKTLAAGQLSEGHAV